MDFLVLILETFGVQNNVTYTQAIFAMINQCAKDPNLLLLELSLYILESIF